MTSQKPLMTGRAGTIVPLVPIAISAFLIVIANVIVMSFRLLLPYPNDPWEAGIVIDAWRMLKGEAVYAVGTDHATHMYGPLVTVFCAQVFRFTGPVLYVGRLASAISGIFVIAILVSIFGHRGRLACGVAVALLLAANTRCSNYFTVTRPDLDSLFFATMALFVLYQGLETAGEEPRPTHLLIGAVLLVIALLFKQTAVMFMFVPLLAIAIQIRTSGFGKRLVGAAIPIVGVLLTFVVINQFAPGLWHFMIQVPAQYHINAISAARVLPELLLSLPLFVLALLHWLFTDAADTWRLPLVRWLMVTLVCTVPMSSVAVAKEGGNLNSLIPVFLCVGAFCVWRAPVALAFLRDTASPLPLRIVTGTLLGCMLLAQVYPTVAQPALKEVLLRKGHSIKEWALVIAEARSLTGKVVCPDDPTIALMAKGYAGRTAVFEGDAGYSRTSLHRVLMKELLFADYVIVMPERKTFDKKADDKGPYFEIVDVEDNKQLLRVSGFTKSAFRTTSTPIYELWGRTRTR